MVVSHESIVRKKLQNLLNLFPVVSHISKTSDYVLKVFKSVKRIFMPSQMFA